MKASAIIMSDAHVSEHTPRVRKDNYLHSLGSKFGLIKALMRKHGGIPVIDGGDITDKWSNTPWLIQWMIHNMPLPLYTCIGNHDLPLHNLSEFDRSTLSLLEAIGIDFHCRGEHSFKDFELFALPYGEEHDREVPEDCSNVLLSHRMVLEVDPKHTLFDYITAEDMLKAHPEYDLIVTGHNHEQFTASITENGRTRHLVNPGSLMVREIGQTGVIDNDPKVYLWYAESNTIEAVPMPCAESDINFDLIQQHKDAKINEAELRAFVDGIEDMKLVGLDFEAVLSKQIKDNDLSEVQEKLIWRMVEDGK